MDSREEVLGKVNKLVNAYKQGLLGGEKMPEDENPGLNKNFKDNNMYFTLLMALNYQRNIKKIIDEKSFVLDDIGMSGRKTSGATSTCL